jgi:hypothetical protein
MIFKIKMLNHIKHQTVQINMEIIFSFSLDLLVAIIF